MKSAFSSGDKYYFRDAEGNITTTDLAGRQAALDAGLERVQPMRFADADGGEYDVAPGDEKAFFEESLKAGRNVKPMYRMRQEGGNIGDSLTGKTGAGDVWVSDFDRARTAELEKQGWKKVDETGAPSLAEAMFSGDTYKEYYSDAENWKKLPENMLRGVAGAVASAAEGTGKKIVDTALNAAAFTLDVLPSEKNGEEIRDAKREVDRLFSDVRKGIAKNILGDAFYNEGSDDGTEDLVAGTLEAAGELGSLYGLGMIGKAGGAGAIAADAAIGGVEGTISHAEDLVKDGEDLSAARVWGAALVQGGVAAAITPLYGKLAGLVGKEEAGRAIMKSYGQMLKAAATDVAEGAALGAVQEMAGQGAEALMGEGDVSLEERSRRVLTSAAVGGAIVAATKVPGALGKWVRDNRVNYARAVTAQAQTALAMDARNAAPVRSASMLQDVKAVTVNGTVVFNDGTEYRPARRGREASIRLCDGTVLGEDGKVLTVAAGAARTRTPADTAAEIVYRISDPQGAKAWRIIDPESGEAAALDGLEPPETARRYMAGEKGVELDAEGWAFTGLMEQALSPNADVSRAAQLALEQVRMGRMSYSAAAEMADSAIEAVHGKIHRTNGPRSYSSTANAPQETQDPSARSFVPLGAPSSVTEPTTRSTASAAKTLLAYAGDGTLAKQKVDVTGGLVKSPGAERGPTPVILLPESGPAVVVSGANAVSTAQADGANTVESFVVSEEDGWNGSNVQAVAIVDSLKNGEISFADAVKAITTLDLSPEDYAAIANGENTGHASAAFQLAGKLSPYARDALSDDNLAIFSAVADFLNPSTAGRDWMDLQNSILETIPLNATETDAETAALVLQAAPDTPALDAWAIASWAEANRDKLAPDATAAQIVNAYNADAAGRTLVETGPGELKTVNELEAEAPKPPPAGESKPTAPARATGDALALTVLPDGSMGCARFPDLHVVKLDNDTLNIEGLEVATMLSGLNRADLGEFLSDLAKFASAHKLKISFNGDGAAAELAQELVLNHRQSARKEAFTQRTNAVLGILKQSGLADDVITDQDAFNAELAKYPGGVQFVKDGKTYGFYANGKIYLNASYFGTKIGLNTTIHEFAHPAVIETKRANPALYKHGTDLIVDTDYYKAVSEAPDYADKSEEDKREEALVRLISDRLENIKAKVPAKIYKEIENFVKEFWKRFGDVNGIRDLTPAMIDTMTVEDVADAIGAEMMYSDDFGFAHPFRDRAADERIKSEFDPRTPTKLVDSMNPVQRKKHLGLHRFLDLHDDQYPALHFYLSHHHAIFPGLSRNDQLEDYIRNLPNDDKMFLLGNKTRRHGDSSLVVRDYLNQFSGPTDDWQDSDIMSAQDLAEQALQERHAYRVWKNKGGLTPDEERELDYYNNFIAQGHTPEEYDQHLRDLMLDEDDPKFSRGGIFTGSAANYDKPSLHYVGTGEGSQVYGWGLYGSTVRGVAEGYARQGDYKKNGKPIDVRDEAELYTAKTLEKYKSVEAAINGVRESIHNVTIRGGNLSDTVWPSVLRELKAHGSEYSIRGEHIYEQTFFTNRAEGDESHLLKWYEPVTSEQIEWIAKEIANYDPTINSAPFVKSGLTGEDIYINLENFGKREYGVSSQDAPKFASELLRDAGIDGVKYPVDSYGKGVKDGDKAGWNYVSFRDDNIRVDHKWTDGKIRFARGGVNVKSGTVDTSSAYKVKDLKNDRPYLQKSNQATNGAFVDSGTPEAHRFDLRSVAAAHSSLELLFNSLPNPPRKVKSVLGSLLGVLDNMKNGKPVFNGGRPLTAKNFTTSLQALGFKRGKGAKSAYYTVDGNTTTRISDHSATAELFVQDGTDNNLSVVIRRSGDKKKFISVNNVNIIEAVFPRSELEADTKKLPYILRDIGEFIATGEYHDTAGAMAYNYSGSDAFKAQARDRIYADALARGDIETAKKMINEAADARLDVFNRHQEGLKKKLMDVVTRDDNGNVIPLSQRFDNTKNDIRFARGGVNAGVGSAALNGEGFVDLEPGDKFNQIEKHLKNVISREVHNNRLDISAKIGSSRKAGELAKHMASGENAELHKFAAKNILELFKNATTGIEHNNKKAFPNNKKAFPNNNNALKIIRAFSPFIFNDEVYIATITLKRENVGDRLYSVEALEIDAGEDAEVHLAGNSAPIRHTSPLSLNRIAYYTGDVKRTSPAFLGALADKEYSPDLLLENIARDASEYKNIHFARGGVGAGGDAAAVFIAGTRVAHDAGRGEDTPGAIAASSELSRQGETPLSAYGSMRRLSLPMSELVWLRNKLAGPFAPARLGVNADVFGIVDKTDMAAIKAQLVEEGMFLCEDPEWVATHRASEVRDERKMSELALAGRLNDLADARVKGTAAGGQSAARSILADKVARVVLDLERPAPGVLGDVRTIAQVLVKNLSSSRKEALADAAAFLDWTRGGGSSSREGAAAGRAPKDIIADLFGAWLVMPAEVERRLPDWNKAIVDTIAGDKQLAEAFKELTVRSMTPQSVGHLMQQISASQSRAAEAALKKLDAEGTDPIQPASKLARAKEAVVIGFDDRLGAVSVRIDDRVRIYRASAREALANAKTEDERNAIKIGLEKLLGNISLKRHQLELSRTAFERGEWNEGRRYEMRLAMLLNSATERYHVSLDNLSLYLNLKRIIETQGRAASFGMSARQAQLALDSLQESLGPDGFAKVQDVAAKFHAIHEQEFLGHKDFKRVFGEKFHAYCFSQANYVTTKRVHSPDELDAIDAMRAELRRAGADNGDDVIAQMFSYWSSGAGKGSGGEGIFTGRLKGSFAASQEALSATVEKVNALGRLMRRSAMIQDLRNVLVAAGVEGVRDFARTENRFPTNSRYGHLNYLENGQKRVLVVPRQIADGFEHDTWQRESWARFVTLPTAIARKLWIDWNPVYWNTNIIRNNSSLERNMPGMRESRPKRLLRLVAPGAANVLDLVVEHAVRHMSEKMSLPLRALFGRHSPLWFVPEAKRLANWIVNPTDMQQRMWAAEDRGDAGAVRQMRQDLDKALEILRANMFIPPSGAYGNVNGSSSFLSDALGRKNLKLLSEVRADWEKKSRSARLLALAKKYNPFSLNAEQQGWEDPMAKIKAYLHDRANFSRLRSPEESGLAVKQNVSIAEGERRGRTAGVIQAALKPFWNIVEKNVMRHYRAVKERPAETLGKDAWVWASMVVSSLLGAGILRKILLKDAGGDERKAAQDNSSSWRFLDDMQRHYQNLSRYTRENYWITPLWLSPSGYTSIVLAAPYSDEDKLVAPFARFVASAAANMAGMDSAEVAQYGLFDLAKDATVGSVVPDLKLSAPFATLFNDVARALVENPYDDFRKQRIYDNDTWLLRNESAQDRIDFGLAVTKQLWNDFGGRGFLPSAQQDAPEAPGAVTKALRSIPLVSPFLGKFLKIQVGSPFKDAQAAGMSDSDKKAAAITRSCARRLLARSRELGQPLDVADPAEYSRLLASWTKTYGPLFHPGKVEASYLNAWNALESADFQRSKDAFSRRNRARLNGMSDEEMDFWLDYSNQ